MSILNKTRTYLVGHMEYVSDGMNWRNSATDKLTKMGIVVYDPYKKPFIQELEEGNDVRRELREDIKNGRYATVHARMKLIRSYDLNLVDRSDFIICHIKPSVASWGSAEELVTANRCKKPIFLSVEGGKENVPLWILGMIPDKYVYNSVDEIITTLEKINNGTIEIDSDRWRLLKEIYR